MMVFAPARRAATVFSRNPPIRRTFPVTVSSPVIAMVGSKDLSNASDSRDVAMVIPAEGPSFTSQHDGSYAVIQTKDRTGQTNHLSEQLPQDNGDAAWLSRKIYFRDIFWP